MREKRSYGRTWLVAVLVGYLEVALAAVVGILYSRTVPAAQSPVDWASLGAGALSLSVVVLVAACVLAAVFVLPAVALSELLGRLLGGREAWWSVPLTTAALVAPPVAAFARYNDATVRSALVFGAVATASLSLGGLIAWPRRAGLLRQVALGGTAVVAGTGLLGAFGLGTGVLPAYEPPRISAEVVAGGWVDHTGGTLTFTEDGRVTAFGVALHAPGARAGDPAPQCSGSGTWTYVPARYVRDQRVEVRVPGCPWPAWRVGGTDEVPRLYQDVGGPDSGERYELRKST
ncbi:hypothetical protein [Streptomyces antimicrobicus]|uniref:Uncharacterized protein n=1 Tax=Streptomyces antimicrobicus TaxID=2883108 RepID=A0ABS8BAH6_9ACTN|nr:hypothetical protein [Streptomyces antimicrobicus]MCB5181616.1 hypothetical protein [Streptomyces antimicrobicus]